MSRKIWIESFLVVSCVSALWFGCGGGGSSSPPANQPGVVPIPTVTVTIPNGSIGMGSAAYGANPLQVTAPTAVVWVNGDTSDGAPHTATSDTGVWDTGALAVGAASAPVVFGTPGMFPYHCTIHGAASMNGRIQVVSAGPSPSPSPSAAGWEQVDEQQTCPTTSPSAGCPASDGFTVVRDGSFFTGSGLSGEITSEELENLNAIATTVSFSAGSAGFSCVEQNLVGAPTALVNETFGNGSSQVIYDSTTGNRLCFFGDIKNAQALFNAINDLARKYDPQKPSPSPSPSVSPSPSPSESMTMLPRVRRHR